jgi:hypothetical protein
MIPWDEFKTPQDAYEWAKPRSERLGIFGTSFLCVWIMCGSDRVYPTDCYLFHLGVRR